MTMPTMCLVRFDFTGESGSHSLLLREDGLDFPERKTVGHYGGPELCEADCMHRRRHISK